MTAQELREKYLNFFKSKGHTIIPSASLIPENDPSVLFTTAGMHPLVPYLLGEKHPGGKRVASVQKCVRTGDIDDVGDNRHLTFFEMLGNWSFGDYFKKEAIEWSFEFLTDKNVGLGLDPKRLYVTVFKGVDEIPRDEETISIWKNVFEKNGIIADVAGEDEIIENNVRIIPLGMDDNFWIAGATGPCGVNSEMFYDTRPSEGQINGKFSDLVNSGRIIEMWNDVFMEFNKTIDGKYEKLKQTNVDTGMGVERTLAVLNGKENVFETELFQPIFEKIEELSGKKYKDHEKEFRIIADHIKASTFMIAEGVLPLNVGRGYVLRRLIRRSIRYAYSIGLKEGGFSWALSAEVIKMYGNFYKEIKSKENDIRAVLFEEEEKFRKTMDKGLTEIARSFKVNDAVSKTTTDNVELIPGDENTIADQLFNLYTTHGFPLELAIEELKNKNINISDHVIGLFNDKIKEHQEKSRTASAGMFKGGLQDASEETTKLHTAAHLMLAALRKILGEDIFQKGSNITAERLRFDFSYPQKLTAEQIKQIEDLINEKIQENIPVFCEEMSLEEAKAQGAMGVFESKYGEKVKVYSIGDFSKEICGGPHVEKTGELGHFKIQKEESSSAGVRRIKAILK